MAKVNKLGPTHVEFRSSDKGRGYMPLKKGATWTDGKQAAGNFSEGAKAKPVRRK
jgi:hypothetical protein